MGCASCWGIFQNGGHVLEVFPHEADPFHPQNATWPQVKIRAPSEHPNPTTKIGPKMGGEFTTQNGIN